MLVDVQQVETSTATLTTTEAAVLALLAIEGERSAYDLMKLVSKAIGYVWAPAKTHLYAVLPRLAKSGLVGARTAREGRRPEKQLYRLTAEGRTALDAWLRAEPDSIETFQLRLFVGSLVPDDVLLEHIEWLRREVGARLDVYRGIEPTNTRTGNDYYHWFLLQLGIERAEHLLDWAGRVEPALRAGPRDSPSDLSRAEGSEGQSLGPVGRGGVQGTVPRRKGAR